MRSRINLYYQKKPTFTQLQPKVIAIESTPREKGNIVIEGSYYRKISDTDLGKAQQLKLSLYRFTMEIVISLNVGGRNKWQQLIQNLMLVKKFG